jgi:hypothetical protein
MGKVTGNSPDLSRLFPERSWHSSWKSLESFARYIEGLDQKKAWHDSGWEGHGEEFHGTKDMKEALHLAQNGWKEGVEKIDKLSNMIYALNPELKRPTAYGVAGSTPNVPRAIAGNPLNMRLVEPASSRRRPVLTIVTNMSENCGVSKDRITNKAATIAAIVDQIEAKGFACEVIAGAGSSGGFWAKSDYSCLTSVMVKEAHHPLDVARLAFGVGHSAMFRRLVFADWGYEETARQGLGRGLGFAGEVSPSKEFAEKHIYIIPVGANFFKDEKMSATKGIKWLIDRLARQGCPAFSKGKYTYDDKDIKFMAVDEPDDED